MFKPIKDFLTFIQKNAANNSIDETSDDLNTNTNVNESLDLDSPIKQPSMDKIEIAELKPGVVAGSINIASNFDEDDIELQIKSSIMIKKPSPRSTPPLLTPIPAITTLSTFVSRSCTSMEDATLSTKANTPDFNQNLQLQTTHHNSPEDDDELADFKNDPLQTSNEDFCSVSSEMEEMPNQNASTEDEDALTETYRDITDKGEIFVVEENDLNSSIGSAEDPLAIDLTTLASSGDETVNLIESSTNEPENYETSTIEDINWFDNENKSTTISPSLTSAATKESNTVTTTTTASSSECRDSTNHIINLCQTDEPTDEIERNDNSDSGLGIETSSLLLQTTINNSITDGPTYHVGQQQAQSNNNEKLKLVNIIDQKRASTIVTPNISGGSNALKTPTQMQTQNQIPILVTARKPLRSNLKRRNTDVAVTETRVTTTTSTTINTQDQETYPPKKPKRSINFDAVNVYYFPRQQGFGCVPSAGGCTLGMGSQHIDTKRLTLAEHAAELRRAHRLQLQEVNPRGSSSEETDESEEDYLSEGSGSDLDADSNGFLQPVPPKQRRAILKAAGVRKIDTSEKVDCRDIRNSREVCGCTCRDFCDPETCGCSQAGIKCQVDRAMFPCGCSRDACGNTTGRVEFNPARVRTHFIHTIMRLDMENRQQQPTTLNGNVSCGYETSASMLSTNNSTGTHNSYYNIQSQSNYSSGYASPAYPPTDPNTNYYPQTSLIYPNPSTEPTASSIASYHSVDGIDGNVFTNPTNTANSSYGSELLSNYCTNNTTEPSTATTTSPYHHSMTYGSAYLSYQQQQHLDGNDYNSTPTTTEIQPNQNINNDVVVIASNTFRSCAVPLQPPFGTATCETPIITATTSDSEFISLSTPIASSSRYSQINDLLQHNRNTTAALVAVSSHSGDDDTTTILSTANNCINSNSNISSIEETSSISNNQKDGCYTFETDLAMTTTTLNTVTTIFVAANKQTAITQNEPPTKTPTTTPSTTTTTTPPIKYESASVSINTTTTTTTSTTSDNYTI